MTAMQGKKIVLGVCGSIAAYKSALLVRLLVQEGAEVQVILTKDAANFITPLTLSTLSGRPVLTDYFDPKTGEWNNHVHLGMQADLFLIAPASANTIAKLAHGMSDNLLAATYLSAKCPVYIAPAMDLDMWQHPATKKNIELLKSYGDTIIPPGTGELASGLTGEGRLAEPDEIVASIKAQNDHAHTELPLSGLNALVSAGPTQEPIDPVRFIGNRSSGKMGFSIAERLHQLGATVTLIAGPTAQICSPSIRRVDVQSALDMLKACEAYFSTSDIVVMAAAVADYTPVHVADKKIKKSKNVHVEIVLKKTTDILKELGERKTEKQTVVGFALETDNEEANAQEKLVRKNLDIIVLNSMRDEGAGFGSDTNKITVFQRSGKRTDFNLKSKTDVAKDICDLIIEYRTSL